MGGLLDMDFDFTSGGNQTETVNNVNNGNNGNLLGEDDLLGGDNTNTNSNFNQPQVNNNQSNDLLDFGSDPTPILQNNVNNNMNMDMGMNNVNSNINISYNRPQPINMNMGSSNNDPLNFKEELSPGFNNKQKNTSNK